MPKLIDISGDLTFALSNTYFSYVFRVTPENLLEHVYYGDPLSDPASAPRHYRRTERHAVQHFEGVKDLNLSEMPQEYPVFGTSDFRYPAFHGRNADGNSIFSFRYDRHDIRAEKPALSGLPSARGGGSETLIVTLVDDYLNIELDLLYTVYADYGVLARSSVIRNLGAAPISLQNVFSSSIDLPPGDYELLHLHGTWARELNAERMAVPRGRFVIDSSRGASSNAHSPFMAVIDKDASETSGRVFASTLVYSGNFAISVETGEFENVRVLTGINPFNFGWTLRPGETFAAPEALHVYSPNGLSGMSHIWHTFIRDKISPPTFHHKPRPTYLNTWEACYFDVTEDRVLSLASRAKNIGVEILVLDDGWFDGRNDDKSSLGDWTADPEKFPSGIPALAEKVKAKGLKFGLWFEPEMVSPDSKLYAKHPDWALHVPGRKASLGRNQLTLDLSRPEVVDYIFLQLDNILSCGDVDYVKWDMNRNMTEAGSACHPPEAQPEIAHRYMLGLYGLLDRLTQKYPNILFENCASGGNRFDLGMLRYMAQNWTSDMCDPIGRLQIINGASYLFPLDVMAAYIGPSPNHQNGRVTSLETRFNAGAFCAARGVSLNSDDIDAYANELRALMTFARKTGTDMVGGDFYRLKHTNNETCWQYSARGGQTVYVGYFHVLSAPNLPFQRVRLSGLDPEAEYQIDNEIILRGDALMSSGLPLPYVTTAASGAPRGYMPPGDFSSCLFVLRKLS